MTKAQPAKPAFLLQPRIAPTPDLTKTATMKYPFDLKPFPGDPSAFSIIGEIGRNKESLSLHFRLRGPLPSLRVPANAKIPRRCDKLWAETCFELFLAQHGQPAYYEVNLSPAGHWNVYRFDDYRQGMREASGFPAPEITVSQGESQLDLSTALDLSALGLADAPLQVAVSAVLLNDRQQPGYWALDHLGSAPDFHRHDGFLLSLGRYNGVE